MTRLVLLAVTFWLGACRPVARACSAEDVCPSQRTCMGGRCELVGKPPAIAETERRVLTPRRYRSVVVGGRPSVLAAFDLAGVPLDRIVEAHVLATLREGDVPRPGASMRLLRASAGWDERSTSERSAGGHLGSVESEARLVPAGPTTVRLHVSAEGLRAQRERGWAVQFEDGPGAADGVHFADEPGQEPRLELYLRTPMNDGGRPPSKGTR